MSFQCSWSSAIMRCLAAQGDRASVNRQYHELAALLDDELGVPPLPSTLQLFEQLLG